jgi:hypothetical protein
MLDWIGVNHDASPRRSSAFDFFVNGCIAGITLGIITVCAIMGVLVLALNSMP